MSAHLFRLLFVFGFVMLVGGCMLTGPSYTDPVDYDLGIPAADSVKFLPLPIRFGVFRNLSGSSRGFLVREGADRLASDEYNRWLLSPELLLQRRIRTQLRDPIGTPLNVRLDASIYRFEFDRARHSANLSVEFTGKADEITEHTGLLSYETIYDKDVPESAARAMAINAEKAAYAVKELVDAISEKVKK